MLHTIFASLHTCGRSYCLFVHAYATLPIQHMAPGKCDHAPMRPDKFTIASTTMARRQADKHAPTLTAQAYGKIGGAISGKIGSAKYEVQTGAQSAHAQSCHGPADAPSPHTDSTTTPLPP